MILDNICDKRKEQLERDISKVSRQDIKAMAAEKEYQTVSFSKSIKRDTLSVISEVKKASPSKGLICPDFDPVKIACEYEKNGANAISCLTEEHYFQGSGVYLKAIREAVKLPILRKDFIIDECQIEEAALAGASAILLIAAILDDRKIKAFMKLAGDLGMDVLAEAHDEREMERLLTDGARIAGVNNRDLRDFTIKMENTEKLARLVPEDVLLVSESGMTDKEKVHRMREAGADAVLIGEMLMKAGNRTELLQELVHENS